MPAEAKNNRTVLEKRPVLDPAGGMIRVGERVMAPDQALEQALEWRQPELLRRFNQLTQDGQEIATLRFENSYGSLATGEYGPAKWTLKRTGFLSPKISVREAGSETNLALFHSRLDGHWLGGLQLGPPLSPAAHQFLGHPVGA
jgi:hypothetical protein